MAVQGDDMLIGVGRPAAGDLLPMQAVDQTFAHRNRRRRAIRVGAPPQVGPVGRLEILDRVDPIIGQEWEERLERDDDVLADVAPVVDDDVDPTDLARNALRNSGSA